MKQVIINGRFLGREMTGVDRYAIETVKALDTLLAEGHPQASRFEWVLATPTASRVLPLKRVKQVEWPYLNGLLWEQVTLPLHSAGRTLLNLCNSAPILKLDQLVVVHDAATIRVPESYSKGFRAWYKVMVPTVLRLSRHIGTVSEFSKKEIASIYNCSRDIKVLTEGAEHLLRLDADDSLIDKHALRQRPYVLAVGSMAPHKNFKTLIKAAELLGNPPFDIVIAGGTNPRIFASEGQSLPAWVKHVGYVTDNQLKSLYQQAHCFVFPSRYEGYGLPPTEAMSLGCPVICASSASLPEICGDAAIYFDADSPDQLASKLLGFFQDAHLGAGLREKGLENVKMRTWRQAALAVLDSLKNDHA